MAAHEQLDTDAAVLQARQEDAVPPANLAGKWLGMQCQTQNLLQSDTLVQSVGISGS